MSKIVLYGMDISPCVRACLLTLKGLGLEYEFKYVDMFTKEHLSEEFVKHNPQHTVPVLNDNGKWLWDSHAICAYLVDKYGKDDSLYPKDLFRRAVVNQRLFFDVEHIFAQLRNICEPVLYEQNFDVTPKHKKDVQQTYEFFEKFVSDAPYVAGDQLTIADFSCVSTLFAVRGVVEADDAKYPNTAKWFKRMAALPYYKEIEQGGIKEVAFLRSKMN